jgi:hypothetical protein
MKSAPALTAKPCRFRQIGILAFGFIAFLFLAIYHRSNTAGYQRYFPFHHAKATEIDASASLAISADFLTFIAQAAVSILTTRLSQITIPDITQRIDVPVLGGVTLTLSDTHVNATVDRSQSLNDEISLDFEPGLLEKSLFQGARLEPTADGRLLLNAAGINVRISCRWRWVKGVAHSHGKAYIVMKDTRFSAAVRLKEGKDESHNVAVSIESPKVTFGEIKLEISESRLTWLYRFIQSTFVKNLKNIVGK